jgi:hypothetical protein
MVIFLPAQTGQIFAAFYGLQKPAESGQRYRRLHYDTGIEGKVSMELGFVHDGKSNKLRATINK